MIRAVLLDLDNTLLENDMEQFIPAYLGLLGQFIADHYPPEAFIRHLMRATDAMMANDGSERTNQEVFDAAFFPAIGRTREEMEPLFAEFYATRFPALRTLTRPVRIARPLMEWLFRQGFQVAIATNSLFPRTAIDQRLGGRAGGGIPLSLHHVLRSDACLQAPPGFLRRGGPGAGPGAGGVHHGGGRVEDGHPPRPPGRDANLLDCRPEGPSPCRRTTP